MQDMTKSVLSLILLLGSLGLAACMAPGTQTGTQTALPTGSSGAVEEENKESTAEPLSEPFKKDPSIAGDIGGTVDPGGDPVGGLPPSSPSSPSSSSPSGKKWPGSIFAENVPTGLPSGQVAPDEAVGEEASLVMDGTKERLCRNGETVTVRVSGQLVLLLKDGSEKKKNFSIHPPVVRFYSSGEGWASYADVPVVQNSSGYYMVEGTIATKYPASVWFHALNPFTNTFEIDIPSRLKEIAPPSSSPLPICPSWFLEPAKNLAPLVSPH